MTNPTMKLRNGSTIEFVVNDGDMEYESHPCAKLFECDYINEPHEEHDPIIPTVIMRGDEVIGYSEAKMSDVVGGLRLNQDYLQRNAENNLHIFNSCREQVTNTLIPTSAICTPSRDSLLTRATRIFLGRE